jgi:hypothetical protein
MGWHPVAAVQYTFTHKQYTEYTERNIRCNYKDKNWEVMAELAEDWNHSFN